MPKAKEAPRSNLTTEEACGEKIWFRGTAQKTAVPCGFRKRHCGEMTKVKGPMTKEFPTEEMTKRADPSAKFEVRNVGAYFFGVKIVIAGTCDGNVD